MILIKYSLRNLQKSAFRRPFFYLRSGSLIFTWRYSLIFLKSPNKITEIVKTVAVGNFCDRIICSGELVTCMFDSLVIQIIHWCLMCHFRKESAEILRRHRHRSRKQLQSKRRSIVVSMKSRTCLSCKILL